MVGQFTHRVDLKTGPSIVSRQGFLFFEADMDPLRGAGVA